MAGRHHGGNIIRLAHSCQAYHLYDLIVWVKMYKQNGLRLGRLSSGLQLRTLLFHA